MKFEKLIKNPYIWAFFLGIISLHIIKEFALLRRRAPEPLADVGPWELLNQDSKPFGQKNLLGKVVIANYFFTSCPSICPKLTEAMKELHERFEKEHDLVSFISITVDPDVDTPERLRQFISKQKINYKNWDFLTGTKKQVYEVVVDTMHVHMGEAEEVKDAPGTYDIPHMGQIALFDQEGRLRGLFKTDSIELSALVRGAKFLLEKSKGQKN